MTRATSIKLITLLLCTLSFFSSAAKGQNDPEQLEETAIRTAVAKVEHSVVRFETIGGTNRVEGVVAANGPSTGVAISKDGYVISS